MGYDCTIGSFALDVMAVLVGICAILYIMVQVGKFSVYLYKLEVQIKEVYKQAGTEGAEKKVE